MMGWRVARWIVVACAGCVASVDEGAPPLPPAPVLAHPSTPEIVALGQALFFDVRLSGDNTISCATCHQPMRAYSDGLAHSTAGASGVPLVRNTPALINLAWSPSLFWDGGARNLESLVLGPITNPDEMNQPVEALIVELGETSMAAAFAAAFPGEQLAPSTLMRAIAAYVRSLVSADSTWDRGAVAAPARRGQAVFERACASCHPAPLFTDFEFHNTGLDGWLDLPPGDPALGRARITFDDADRGAYRTPTLRNVGFTAPYMHDGRFATLSEVIDHYRFGVVDSPSLAPALRDIGGAARGIELSDAESAELLEFLQSLDDRGFTEAM